MDALVWWSGAADRLRHDMAADADQARHRPLRWLPLLPMACGAGLLYAAIAGVLPAMMIGCGAPLGAVAAAIAINGPLGKRSLNDGERAAALRKNAFFFCLALLALANIAGAPALLAMAALRHWSAEHQIIVASELVICNLVWFLGLPTLHASWRLPRPADNA